VRALRANWQVLSVTVFEAAMRPMIGASIVAMEHDLDPPLVTLMVGAGIPLSFLTLPSWWHLMISDQSLLVRSQPEEMFQDQSGAGSIIVRPR
jgi:hypothetical protein